MKTFQPSTCANSPLGDSVLTTVVQTGPSARAAEADVRWPNGSTLKVGFLNRNDAYGQTLRQKVREIAPIWSEFANIQFTFTDGPTEHITINFLDTVVPFGTYSSYLGTQSEAYAQANQPSMNLVFDPDNPSNNDDEFHRVILHEFGHALGLIHEHMRPDRPIQWNRPEVIRYYSRLTGGQWDGDMVDAQIIASYREAIVDKTSFDPTSIMMYPFPAGLASYADGQPFETGWNRELSPEDKTLISRVYPR